MKDKLKKLTFAMLLMAMTSTAAFAEGLTDSSDDVVWGYCDDDIYTSLGMGENEPFKCAIRIPSAVLAKYKGCTISRIDVRLVFNVTELVPVISTGGSENYADQPARLGVEGWNEIELENPYTIGTNDLYVGYQYVGSFAAATSKIRSEYGIYGFEEGKWEDYSEEGWGSFSIRFHIKGNNLPMDVAMMTNESIESPLGESVKLTPTIQNLSPEKVNSLTVNCYIDGVFEGSHEVAADIEKGKYGLLPFTITPSASPGMHNIKIQVVSINGKQDVDETNNTVTIPLTIIGKSFARRIVMEEITGTWCGHCPRGIHAMKTMAEKYPDNFIGIAVHGGDDEMVGAENYKEIFNVIKSGYPSSIANRNDGYQLNASLQEMEEVVLAMKDISIADIKAEMTVLDADTTEVMIKTSTEFGMDLTVPFRIAYVVLENGVGPYVQENYYSGTDTDLGGLEKEGQYIYMTYNDVARGIYDGFNGVEGSLPKTVKSGETYNYEYRLRLPQNIDNKANIEVVAMIINQDSGEIANACKCKFDGKADNIRDIMDATSKETIIYNINGIRQDAPQRGINIIRMSNGMTRKMMVR